MLITAAGHRLLLARFQNGQKNSHMLLLPWGLEHDELSLGFQFQQCSIMPDWYLGNQSIMAWVRPYYYLKYNLLADTWTSRLLCVRSVCAVVYAFVSPDGKHSLNWQSAQPAIGQNALLFLIQWVVLNYMDYWWLLIVISTETVSIFSARFPVQMEVNSSVQTILLLAHAYPLYSFGREQVVLLSHKGCLTVPNPITVYDSKVEWHISMYDQCIFIGVMNMGYEIMLLPTKFSFAGNTLTCFTNSGTPSCHLMVASSELMWFHMILAAGQGTFQGGRHMPVFYQQKKL